VRIDHNLSSLDTKLRSFIDDYRKEHHDAIEVTRRHISSEFKRSEGAVKDHVTQIASKTADAVQQHIETARRSVIEHDKDAQLTRIRNKLLQSLKFDRMNERRNQIKSVHLNTCTWMLRDGSENSRPDGTTIMSDDESNTNWNNFHKYAKSTNRVVHWDSFSDWLRSTETVYWISGKPGSGKTSAMKYILARTQTREYLNLWKSDSTVISHYFWRPGTTMQQSIKGLLCSLLHQLLLGDIEAVQTMLRGNEEIQYKDTDTDWSEEELQKHLEDVVNHYSRPIAIFLDGLDEVLPKDGVQRLLRVVERLKELYKSSGKVKICLASRPEPLLTKLLGGYPKLRLEQLNHPDLVTYAEDQIRVPDDYSINIQANFVLHHGNITFSQRRLASRYELRDWLVSSLVKKAEGVFLWLCLTTTALKKALDEGETVEDLKHRIDNLPGDLVDLYADMWVRANNDGVSHRRRAASYLQLALAGTRHNYSLRYPLNPFVMMAATTPEMADSISRSDSSQRDSAVRLVDSLVNACEATRRDVTSRCAGLLECPTPMEDGEHDRSNVFLWHGEEYDRIIPYVWDSPTYSFLHRTARDFLEDTEAGRKILSYGSFAGELARLQLLEAHLAICQLIRIPEWTRRSTQGNECKFVMKPNSGVIRSIIRDIWRYNDRVEDEVAKKLSQLLYLCERLFNRGFLLNCLTISLLSAEFHCVSQGSSSSYTYYEATVNQQHEFLIEVARCSEINADILNYLLPVLQGRSLDHETLSQVLLYACSFREISSRGRVPQVLNDIRLSSIKALLSLGASPCLKVLSRSTAFDPACVITSLETPFKALMKSFWDIFINFELNESYSQMLFELIPLFLTHGADLQEEIYTIVQVRDGHMSFKQFWPGYSESLYPMTSISNSSSDDLPGRIGIIALVMAYPASAILATIIQMLQPTKLPQADWLPEPWKMTQGISGRGKLVAVTDFGASRVGPPELFPPALFRIAETYPLVPETSLERGLLRLISLAEDSVQGVGRYACDYKVSRAIFVPLEIQGEVIREIERMSLSKVPITKRRKELRMRLDICTPLEKPDWQWNNLKRLLLCK
jgi:hypothetical protein